MNYKLIVWGDISIPVKEKYKWLAKDASGGWFAYTNKPRIDMREAIFSPIGEGSWGNVVSREYLQVSPQFNT